MLGTVEQDVVTDADVPQERRALHIVIPAAAFLVGLLVFAYSLWLTPLRPGNTPGAPKGYYGWFDQGEYLVEAQSLARGELPPKSRFFYPLGYPALGAAAIKLGFEGDPFAPFDALAFAGMLACVAIVAARIRGPGFAVAVTAGIAFATPLLDLTVTPWSSTVTMLAVCVALVVATSPRGPTIGAAVALGLAVGLSFAARLGDGIFVGIVCLALLAQPAWRAVKPILTALAVAFVLVALTMASHNEVFGSPFTTPYVLHTRPEDPHSDEDLSAYNLRKVPRSGWEMFVIGNPEESPFYAAPIFREFPWAVAAPLGLLVLIRRRHPLRGALLVASAASVIGTVFYLSFRATGGGSLQYGSMHYLKAWFPLWGLLAGIALAAGADAVVRRARPE